MKRMMVMIPLGSRTKTKTNHPDDSVDDAELEDEERYEDKE